MSQFINTQYKARSYSDLNHKHLQQRQSFNINRYTNFCKYYNCWVVNTKTNLHRED